MVGTIVWISFTPVKGLRLQHREEVQLTESGVPGDRAFFLVDERGTMVSGKRLGSLMTIVAKHSEAAQTLSLLFADGVELTRSVELGAPEDVRFYELNMRARPVLGEFSTALSRHCGTPLRLFAAPPERSGIDRGDEGAVTLLSLGSLDRLRLEAGEADPIDPRRFRMTFGVDGPVAHEEDEWVGRTVCVGGAVLEVAGHVGRCAVTTRNADSGVVDFKTLHHLNSYRGAARTTEPLPFGVHARVVQPGRVRVGDALALA